MEIKFKEGQGLAPVFYQGEMETDLEYRESLREALPALVQEYKQAFGEEATARDFSNALDRKADADHDCHADMPDGHCEHFSHIEK